MALNSTGPLSLGGSTVGQSINLELGQSATALASINATNFRTLAGVASGQISISNFYGKSSSVGYYSFVPSPGPTAGSYWAQGGYLDSSGNVYISWYTNAFKMNAAGTVQWSNRYTFNGSAINSVVNYTNNSSTSLFNGGSYTTVAGWQNSTSTSTKAVGMIINSDGSPTAPFQVAPDVIPGGYTYNSTSTNPLCMSLGPNSGAFAAGSIYSGSNPGYYCCGVYYPGSSLTWYSWGLMHFRNRDGATNYDTYVNIQQYSFYYVGGPIGMYTNNNTGNNYTWTTSVTDSVGTVVLRAISLSPSGGGSGIASYSFKWSTNQYVNGGQVTAITANTSIYHAGTTNTNYGVITKFNKATTTSSLITGYSAYSVSNSSYQYYSANQPVLTTDSSGNVYVGIAVLKTSQQNAVGFWLAKFNSSFVLQWQREIFETASTVSGYTSSNQLWMGINQMNVSSDGNFLNCYGYFALSTNNSYNLRQGLALNLPTDGSKTGTITINYPTATSTYVLMTYAAASSTVSSVSLTTGGTDNTGNFNVVVGNTGTLASTTSTYTPTVTSGNW